MLALSVGPPSKLTVTLTGLPSVADCDDTSSTTRGSVGGSNVTGSDAETLL